MEQSIVKNDILINAPVSKVWDMLTKPEWTRQYMHSCEVITDWTVGSPIYWDGEYEGKITRFVTGTVLAFDPEKFLSYTTFDPNGTYEDTPENHLVVTYALKEENGKTHFSVTQGDYSKVSNGEARYKEAMDGGGWGSILEAIKALAE